jgi:hypothetical protein
MDRVELAPPCRIAAPPGGGGGPLLPWMEAALLVRVRLPAWQHREEAWLHWAVALAPDGSPAASPRRFEPGRYAREPLAGGTTIGADVPGPGEAEARAFVGDLLASWRPVVHRHVELGLVSGLDEPREAFRRRCLAALRPLLTDATGRRESAAAELARVAGGIETAVVERADVELRFARVGVGWYPEGREPVLPPDELLITGAARGAR